MGPRISGLTQSRRTPGRGEQGGQALNVGEEQGAQRGSQDKTERGQAPITGLPGCGKGPLLFGSQL